jgi:hypothetical protein
MRKFGTWGLSVVTVVFVATALLMVTGWDSAIGATITSVFVTNTATHPVPVKEQGIPKVTVQNVDATGNMKVHEQGTAKVLVQNSTALPVHEQGTANVNVTNGSLSVAPAAAITGGGYSQAIAAGSGPDLFSPLQVASALTIHMGPGVNGVTFYNNGSVVASFPGPHNFGRSDVELALTRPISFDEIVCGGSSDVCSVGWVGNSS